MIKASRRVTSDISAIEHEAKASILCRHYIDDPLPHAQVQLQLIEHIPHVPWKYNNTCISPQSQSQHFLSGTAIKNIQGTIV